MPSPSGQRQQIAIARAIAANPRHARTFDEAMSALDDVAETVLQQHMAQIVSRVVRYSSWPLGLSAVRQAHRIYIMDKREDARSRALMKNC